MAAAGDSAAEERFMANDLNPGAMNRLETRSRVERFLRGRGLTHLFQPVFDLTSGECFAVEASPGLAVLPSARPRCGSPPRTRWASGRTRDGVGETSGRVSRPPAR
jgi:hypothetical protein